MRVSPVSFRSSSVTQSKQADRAYWHVIESAKIDPNYSRADIQKNSRAIVLGLIGVGLVVAATFIKFQKRGATLVPKDVVEIFDQTKGLNKIEKYLGNVQEIKEKILYPYKAVMSGDSTPLTDKTMKTGLVIGSNNTKEVQEILRATGEHAQALGIDVVTCPFEKMKVNLRKSKLYKPENHEEFKMRLARSVRDWLFQELKKGEIRFKETGKYTFINMGSMDTMSSKEFLGGNLKALEGLQKLANNQDVKGVCWLSCTEDKGTMDFFFNESSILVTKLVE